MDEHRKQTLDGLRKKIRRLEGKTKKLTPNAVAPQRSAQSGHAEAQPPPAASGLQAGALTYSRSIPRRVSQAPRYVEQPETFVCLESACRGTVLDTGPRGTVYAVETWSCDFEEAGDIDARFVPLFSRSTSPLIGRICSAGAMSTDPPPTLAAEDFIFMDLETTGLGGSALFLIGIMVLEPQGFVVRQYFARTYAEEAAALTAFIDQASRRSVLVTFNGKTFDYPYIKTRCAATAVPFEVQLEHFDLLHECRRVWKDELPNCRLQTLERLICGRARFDDIPGHRIPDAYHAWVRSGNAAEIRLILHHNLLDLITLADIMTRFPR
jgi:uncharacterized protein YprB with RNaseH-like and TPR domain